MAKIMPGSTTDLEVDALMASLNLAPGSVHDDATISKLIGVAPGSARYRNIERRLCKRVLTERGLILTRQRGLGQLSVLIADQVQDRQVRGFQSQERKTRRMVAEHMTIDTTALSSSERQRLHDVISRELLAMEQAAKQRKKAVRLARSPQPLRKDAE
jgi:hypothetical protein